MGTTRRASKHMDPTQEGPMTPCLVVIRGEYLGRKILLDDSMSIGRDDTSDIQFYKDNLISRRHALLDVRRDAIYIEDKDSSNGTKVNNEQVSEKRLNHGDVIGIGAVLLKVLCRGDIGAAYDDEIRKMSSRDSVTGLLEDTFFVSKMVSALQYEQSENSSLVVFEMNELTNINRMWGQREGNRVLQKVSEKIGGYLGDGDFCGRLSGLKIAVYRSDASEGVGRRWAENTMNAIRPSINAVEPFLVSVGIVPLSKFHVDPRDLKTDVVEDILSDADETLYAAKRLGANCVVVHGDQNKADISHRQSGVWRRPISKDVLASKLEEEGRSYVAVMALEIAQEKAIIKSFGAQVLDSWVRDLMNIVAAQIGEGDHFSVWKERCIFVAIKRGGENMGPEFQDQVRSAFRDNGGQGDRRERGYRKLSFASLSSDELATFRRQDLDRLIGTLVVDHDQRTVLDELPFPISSLRTIPETRAGSLGRVRALIDILDVGYRFLVAMAISLVITRGDDMHLEKMADVVSPQLGRSPTSGTWIDMAYHLAKIVPQSPNSAAAKVVDQLLNPFRKSSELTKLLRRAVMHRNKVAHERIRGEGAYLNEEEELRMAVDRLVDAMEPLTQTRLVSVVNTAFSNDPNQIDYRLRLHQGPTESFPIIQETLPQRLHNQWCYLIDSDRRPLPLVPFFYTEVCQQCGRREVFLAEKVVFGLKYKKIKAKGLLSNHPSSKEVARIHGIQRFHEVIERRRSAEVTGMHEVPEEFQ